MGPFLRTCIFYENNTSLSYILVAYPLCGTTVTKRQGIAVALLNIWHVTACSDDAQVHFSAKCLTINQRPYLTR